MNDSHTEASWVQRVADAAVEHARKSSSASIVCASGISPSGPIHLGNLREVMTAHLVAEEIKARGIEAVHVHSWDDYDRLRKVPAGLPEEWARYIGMPLASVPDPYGRADSYATHFIDQFIAAVRRLGVEMREVRQSQQYPAGAYNASIRHAMDSRGRIFDILEQFQTEGRHETSIEERRAAYFPFKPYCEVCGKDVTEVTGWAGDWVSYECRCGHRGSMSLADGARISGKLVWKVDWPMRWAFERVAFEPAGEDHHAPSSSFASGKVLVRDIFGSAAPSTTVYSFVRVAGGGAKLSSSAGGAATPDTALDILEPAMVRWLYARRLPSNSFTIDLAPSAVLRLYDEWDRFSARTAAGDASPVEAHLHQMSVRTSAGPVESSARPVPFRLLASVADITASNAEQMERLVRQQLTADGAVDLPDDAALLTELEPRLNNAIHYAKSLPEADRTVIRATFNAEAWAQLDEHTRDGVQMLVERMTGAWTLEELTTTVYAVPKLMHGLPADAAPTPELKKAQRAFFQALYRLLCSRDTGPRLPTLLLSIGPEKARTLLVPPA
ncbi:lysine--tRNA ligase [Nocardia panacis]|uniref:Lysine--tRNA ligase n=1 Tax=Nocardia panacis TaxID=2340916 RepID=A0A3A4KFQ6_9NOCA|nr:lysine--tRNA ligase [Nocardia panacis]RJO71468.1 lysine--tRNA ligase [Nocardia panacis]